MRETADEFETRYAAASGYPVKWFHANEMRARPCDCGEDICRGWQMMADELWDFFDRDEKGAA